MRNRTKKILLIILLFSTSVFGQYVAPNEDTRIYVGGLGTQADKAQLNGGGATEVVAAAGSPSDFMGTNGGPKRTASCAFTTATKNLNGTDIGNGITVGTLCYVSTGDGSHITAGVYEITTVTDNDNIICLQIDDDGTNDTGVTVNVGGALDGIQNALDNPVNNGASYNRYIYDNITTETISATIDVDTYGGANTGTKVIVKGANSSCVVDGTKVIITTDQDLVAGLLSFTSTSQYTQWWYIDFNAGGANKADYCIYNASTESTSSYHAFYDCIFQGAADETGVWIESTFWNLHGCVVHSNGNGVWNDGGNSFLEGCSIHDNTGYGIKLSAETYVLSCIIYDNGADGIDTDSAADYCLIRGNTIFGNATHGIDLVSGALNNFVTNNTSCGNGTSETGYGYNLNARSCVLFFAYNHSCDNHATAALNNWDGHCNLMTDSTSDSEWDDLFEGNNQHGDPKFTSIADGSENFTPTTGSTLIDNALDAGTN